LWIDELPEKMMGSNQRLTGGACKKALLVIETRPFHFTAQGFPAQAAMETAP
jgi:hypothetical protein